ncbi:MAG: hypothetical protein Q9187_007934 [Circinaria calcarea]
MAWVLFVRTLNTLRNAVGSVLKFKLLLEGHHQPHAAHHSPTIRPLLLNGNGRIDGVGERSYGNKKADRSTGSSKSRKNDGIRQLRRVELLQKKHVKRDYKRLQTGF